MATINGSHLPMQPHEMIGQCTSISEKFSKMIVWQLGTWPEGAQ